MRSAFFKKVLVGGLGLIILFVLLDLIVPFPINIAYSSNIYYADGELMHSFLSSDDKWRMKGSLQEYPEEFAEYLIAKEDQYFYYHPGINVFALGRALFQNIKSSSRASGASTITMQLARLLSPADRTYLNKFIEMFRALQLEAHYSKKQILEAYINLLPYGGNIEGLKAASYLYFQKPPSLLNKAECLAFAVIPNTPNSLWPGKFNQRIIKRRDEWARRLLVNKLITAEESEEIQSLSFAAFRTRALAEVPQFALRMRKEHPKQVELTSHINKRIQNEIERIVLSYIERAQVNEYHNASVLLIDNYNSSVLSYLGSNNFKDKINYGENDGVQMIRSPGSTLKPLLFAKALEEGIISPSSILLDVPQSFSAYLPENYDDRYRGNISAAEALQRSLNVPFVALLDQVGVKEFTNQLNQLGFKQVNRDRNKLGLSLILGGCGASLEELCAAYHCLSQGGKISEIQMLKDQEKNQKSILSEASCFITSEVLKEVKRPNLPEAWKFTSDYGEISWKTGTSYGRRDAWTFAYNEKYTLGVWVGNFSGKGVPNLSGYESAAPLAFEIFKVLPNSTQKRKTPESVSRRLVCTKGGKIPSDFCDSFIEEFFIPGMSPNANCNHMERVLVSPNEDLSFCYSCLGESAHKEKLYPNIHPLLNGFIEEYNLPKEPVPVHNPECEALAIYGAPEIISPNPDLEYLIDDPQTEIALKATTSSEVKKLYWFINDRHLATVASNETVFYSPPAGKLKVSCSDGRGRLREIHIDVKHLF